MTEASQGLCFLCSKKIDATPGARVVRATISSGDSQAGDLVERIFHLTCFHAFTTGSRSDGDVLTYRIVDAAPEIP